MCGTLLLSSQRPLPTISWNEDDPSFYILEITEQKILGMIRPIVSGRFYYEAFSAMGCSCGLSFSEDDKYDPYEDYEQRVKDVHDLATYLDVHKVNNDLRLFCSDWSAFLDLYPRRTFSTAEMRATAFYFEERVILEVQ